MHMFLMLDHKSVNTVMVGVSTETKGYKLFDPVKKRVIISRDAVFEEEKKWDCDNFYQEHNRGLQT